MFQPTNDLIDACTYFYYNCVRLQTKTSLAKRKRSQASLCLHSFPLTGPSFVLFTQYGTVQPLGIPAYILEATAVR